MRKVVWIVCVALLVVCALLQLRKSAEHPISLPLQDQQALGEQSSPVQQPKQPNGQDALIESNRKLPAPATNQAPEITKDIDPGLLASWQAPIEFYGKTVDQEGNPVTDVNIHFSWAEFPMQGGERTEDAQSDTDGLFALHGKRGASLSVSFAKSGYYASGIGQKSFTYALGPNIVLPDPQNPVIFLMRKKGEGADLVTSENGIRSSLALRIPKDGVPVQLDFFKKGISQSGQLEISQNKPPWKDATEWSFALSIPNGGLVENQDEFQFEAPDALYQRSVGFHFTSNETNWTTHVTKQFYIAFGQPRQFGWLQIESDLAQETVFITYAINPTGSRNLEPAN